MTGWRVYGIRTFESNRNFKRGSRAFGFAAAFIEYAAELCSGTTRTGVAANGNFVTFYFRLCCSLCRPPTPPPPPPPPLWRLGWASANSARVRRGTRDNNTHTSKILICGFRRRNRRRRRAFGKQTTVYSRRVVSSCAPQSFPPRPPVGDDGGSFRNRLSLRNDEKKKYEKKKFQVFPRYRNTSVWRALEFFGLNGRRYNFFCVFPRSPSPLGSRFSVCHLICSRENVRDTTDDHEL